MTYQEIRKLCKEGKIGMIPGWTGYIRWKNNLLVFTNEDYTMSELELKSKIIDRTDLYYII